MLLIYTEEIYTSTVRRKSDDEPNSYKDFNSRNLFKKYKEKCSKCFLNQNAS